MIAIISAVPSFERTLVRKWRESLNLTLEAVGKAYRPKAKTVARISEIELRENAMQVDSILEVIDAMQRASGYDFGPTPRLRLVRFFQGYGYDDALARAETAVGQAHRDIRAERRGARR